MTKRISIYFPIEAAGWLLSIKRRSRLQNNADVIRAALSVYDDLIKLDAAGRSIIVIDKKGIEWPYSPFSPFEYPGLSSTNESEKSHRKINLPRNFVFSKEAGERLQSIRKLSYLPNNSDVIRAALCAYDELIRVKTVGDRIIIRDQQGNESYFNPYSPFFASVEPARRRKMAGSSVPLAGHISTGL